MEPITPLIISSGVLTFVLFALLIALAVKPHPPKNRKKVRHDISKIKREIADEEEQIL